MNNNGCRFVDDPPRSDPGDHVNNLTKHFNSLFISLPAQPGLKKLLIKVNVLYSLYDSNTLKPTKVGHMLTSLVTK